MPHRCRIRRPAAGCRLDRRRSVHKYRFGMTRRPRILLLAGLDPSGGAGLAADLPTVLACGGHPLPLATALTVQAVGRADGLEPVSTQLLTRQLETLLDEAPIAAIKIGLLPRPGHVRWVAELLDRLRVPAVIDPVLRASAGSTLADAGVADAIRRELAPRVSLMTPNRPEAATLFGTDRPTELAAAAHAAGCRALLVTGGDTPGDPVTDWWWQAESGRMRTLHQQRIAGTFRGCGCTLSSAVATWLGRGASLPDALRRARAFVRRALSGAYDAGGMRRIPRRCR